MSMNASKVVDLHHAHRVLADDAFARAATGAWEPPPRPDATDDPDHDAHDTEATDKVIRQITRKDPNIGRELAYHYAILRDKWHFIEKPTCLLNTATNELYAIKNFLSIEARRRIDFPALDGKVTRKAVAPMWFASPYRINYAAPAYEPGLPQAIKKTLKSGKVATYRNLWDSFPVEPKPGDISLWVRLLDHIFGAAHEARRFFEGWCASQIQNLNIKHHVALLLHSMMEGSGKSLPGEVMVALFGSHSYELNNRDWKANFNSWAKNRRFILVNEIFSSRDGDAETLKNFITQRSVTINQKNIEAYSTRDSIAYFLTSNRGDALRMSDFDRRFWIWQVPKRIDQRLANRVGQWKETPEGQAALLDYLMHFDLGDFDPHAPAPMTTAKLEMISVSRESIDSFIHDEIDAAREGQAPIAVVEGLIRRLDSDTRRSLRDPRKAMGLALHRAGAVRLKQIRISSDLAVALGLRVASLNAEAKRDCRCRPWALAEIEHWQQASDAEIRAALEGSIPKPEGDL